MIISCRTYLLALLAEAQVLHFAKRKNDRRKENLYLSNMGLARTVFALLVLLVLMAPAESAQAGSLFVDAATRPGGDGSAKHPFVRITDAIERARAIRSHSTAQIVIHVAPGIYVGSYTNTGPTIEPLPIRLDVPRLKILGSTSLERDNAGLPTGVIEPGSNSLLRTDPPLVGDQVLLVVASTSDEVLDRVTIAKLSLDTMAGDAGENLVFDRVQDFIIRDNYITGGIGSIGIDVSRSSGQILGNYITRVGVGMIIDGGDTSSPARVMVSRNRSVNNTFGGALLSGSSFRGPSLVGSLFAIVCGNDLSDNTSLPNFSFGLRFIVIEAGDHQISGSVTATICNNRIRNNSFGVVMDAGFPFRFDPRLYTGTFNLTFRDNEVVGNIKTPALISFTRNTAALNPNQLSWKYLESSTFDITYFNGELDGYWFDHPETDPVDGRILENVLRINGDEIHNGRYIPLP